MIIEHEVLAYNSLAELQATYRHDNPDVRRLKDKYGEDVLLSRIQYPVGRIPRFELKCYSVADKER